MVEYKEQYSLRLYDDELVTFALYDGGIAGLQAEVTSVNSELSHLLPLELEVSGDGIVRWLGNRIIPKIVHLSMKY